MIETLTAWLSVWGLALIVIFNAAGRCGIPAPSSLLMILAGALVVETQAQLMTAVAVAYLAALGGISPPTGWAKQGAAGWSGCRRGAPRLRP